MNIKVGSQVQVKSQVRDNIVVRIGNVIKVNSKTATVQFPKENVRAELPINKLEPVEKRFGVSRTQISPIRRG